MREECKKFIELLMNLSRLSFKENETEKLCEDIEKIQMLLKQVSSIGKYDVKPLYNVWDGLLEPPYYIEIPKVRLDEMIPEDRLLDKKVKIPWRRE
ncbi:MAG: hypothetical protein C0171_01540 [Caldisphaera sp.]|nr:MAG: hypothetical protein C0201_04120 [Caldisphaera sp.]PMP92085.1 MAG: hypothetical protein C0171_01540 [Caldisphaera sp.]